MEAYSHRVHVHHTFISMSGQAKTEIVIAVSPLRAHSRIGDVMARVPWIVG